MSTYRSVVLGVGVALAGHPALMAQQPAPAKVTLAQFRQVPWLIGSWRGSGGSYPAFFEEYRFLNDSTIRMRSLADSTLKKATDSSTIEWRNGGVTTRDGGTPSVVIAWSADSIRFIRAGTTLGGHTFTRISANEWKATLHPSSPGRQSTVYVMKRIRP